MVGLLLFISCCLLQSLVAATGSTVPLPLRSCTMKRVNDARMIAEAIEPLPNIKTEQECAAKCLEVPLCDSATFQNETNKCLIHPRRMYKWGNERDEGCCVMFEKDCPKLEDMDTSSPAASEDLCPLETKTQLKPLKTNAYRVLRHQINRVKGINACRNDDLCAGFTTRRSQNGNIAFDFYYDVTPDESSQAANVTVKKCKNVPLPLRNCTLKRTNNARMLAQTIELLPNIKTEKECAAKCLDVALCNSATFTNATKVCSLHPRRKFKMGNMTQEGCCVMFEKECPMMTDASKPKPGEKKVVCSSETSSLLKPSKNHAYRVLRHQINFAEGATSCNKDKLCAGFTTNTQPDGYKEFTFYFDVSPPENAQVADVSVKKCEPAVPLPLRNCTMKRTDDGRQMARDIEPLPNIKTEQDCVAKCWDVPFCAGATFNNNSLTCSIHPRRQFTLGWMSKEGCCVKFNKECPMVKNPRGYPPRGSSQLMCPLERKIQRKPALKYAYREVRYQDDRVEAEYGCRAEQHCAGFTSIIEERNGKLWSTFYYDLTPDEDSLDMNMTEVTVKNCESAHECGFMTGYYDKTFVRRWNRYKRIRTRKLAECANACQLDDLCYAVESTSFHEDWCTLFKYPYFKDVRLQTYPGNGRAMTWRKEKCIPERYRQP